MSLLLIKDCVSFIPMKDGTYLGDERFCDLSFKCKQVGMIAKSIKIVLPNDEEHYELLCTGMKVTNEEDKEIIKAS